MADFRLGLYDPDPDDNRVKLTGRVYRDTPLDRLIVQAVIKRYNQLCARTKKGWVCLGVFPARARKRASR
jgi:hypothetical protein